MKNDSKDNNTTEVNISTKRKIQIRSKKDIAGVKSENTAITTTSTSFVDTGLTKCTETRVRLTVARKWLDKILESYDNPDDWIEHFTEAFLVSTRSIADYIVRDFFGILRTKIKFSKNFRN